MKRYLAASAAFVLLAAGAHAQQFGPPPFSQLGPMQRPILSPYLNITGLGNPAINYFNGTNFQIDQRLLDLRMLTQPNVSLANPSAPAGDDLIPVLPQTGHAVGFQYYNPFYYGNTASATRSYFPYNPNQNTAGTGQGMTQNQRPPTR